MKEYVITLFAGEDDYCNEQIEIECEGLEQDGVFSVILNGSSKVTFERGIEKIRLK